MCRFLTVWSQNVKPANITILLLLSNLKEYLYILMAMLPACTTHITSSPLTKSDKQWQVDVRWLDDYRVPIIYCQGVWPL